MPWRPGVEGGMKKLLPVLVVVAIVAAALFFFLKSSTDQLDMAPGRAAELAPADAIVFLEFPDIQRSKGRWKETSIRKIADEPEWKEFTGKWDEFAAQNAEWHQVAGVLGQIERADPAGLFVAFSSFDGPLPKMVGGFPYRGKKSDVQAVVSNLRTKILDAYPAAKAGDLTNYEGTEVETLKDKDMTISMAYRDNWFFFASDTELLLKTLSRYIRKPDAPAALASDTVWKNTIQQGLAGSDMTLFVRWSALAKKFEDILSLAGANPMVASHPSRMESLLYSAKMDGLLMRDHFYVRARKPFKVEPFANRSAAFTSAATYAYLATQMGFAVEGMQESIDMFEKSPIGVEFEKVLAKKGLKVADIFSALGPEISMLSDWESGGLSLPTFFASVEIRDKAKARLLADLMVSEADDSKKVVISQEDGATLWTFPPEAAIFQPTFAMNETHIVFGLTPATVKAVLKQAKEAGGHVSSKADYQTALKTVAAPTSAMLFVDLKTLFERLYEKLKPMAAYAIIGQPEVSKYLDSAKLPKAETISRHLLPMMISWSEADSGMQMDCSGSLSFFQSYVPAFVPVFVLGSMRARTVPMPPPSPPVADESAVPAPK